MSAICLTVHYPDLKKGHIYALLSSLSHRPTF